MLNVMSYIQYPFQYPISNIRKIHNSTETAISRWLTLTYHKWHDDRGISSDEVPKLEEKSKKQKVISSPGHFGFWRWRRRVSGFPSVANGSWKIGVGAVVAEVSPHMSEVNLSLFVGPL